MVSRCVFFMTVGFRGLLLSKFSRGLLLILMVCLVVSQLKLANGAWNVALLDQLLPLLDVAAIISLPPFASSLPDSLLWHYEKSGSYSVRSGYKVALASSDVARGSGLSSSKSWWKFLWRLSLPPKIKLFI
ncbi:hypothetical protein ACOSQ4_023804 [Xanthoceras sorbifolium]